MTQYPEQQMSLMDETTFPLCFVGNVSSETLDDLLANWKQITLTARYMARPNPEEWESSAVTFGDLTMEQIMATRESEDKATG